MSTYSNRHVRRVLSDQCVTPIGQRWFPVIESLRCHTVIWRSSVMVGNGLLVQCELALRSLLSYLRNKCLWIFYINKRYSQKDMFFWRLLLNHQLLTLMSFQTCLGFFLLQNTKEDILKKKTFFAYNESDMGPKQHWNPVTFTVLTQNKK